MCHLHGVPEPPQTKGKDPQHSAPLTSSPGGSAPSAVEGPSQAGVRSSWSQEPDRKAGRGTRAGLAGVCWPHAQLLKHSAASAKTRPFLLGQESLGLLEAFPGKLCLEDVGVGTWTEKTDMGARLYLP